MVLSALTKYRARQAHIKELASFSREELELEYRKLANPHPPSYNDIFGSDSGGGREALSTTRPDASRAMGIGHQDGIVSAGQLRRGSTTVVTAARPTSQSRDADSIAYRTTSRDSSRSGSVTPSSGLRNPASRPALGDSVPGEIHRRAT